LCLVQLVDVRTAHMASRSQSTTRFGPSRRDRNCANVSPLALRRIKTLIALSVNVPGIVPIPASAAIANVLTSVGICIGPTQRNAGPALVTGIQQRTKILVIFRRLLTAEDGVRFVDDQRRRMISTDGAEDCGHGCVIGRQQLMAGAGARWDAEI
jgi:hypothetical protein